MLKQSKFGVLAALTVVAGSTLAVANNIDRLATNIYEQSLAPAPSANAIKATLALQRTDGGYSDIDYASTAKAGWKPQTHLNRLNDLANAWCDPNSEYHRDPAIQAAIVKGYAFWLEKDPQSTNWFFGSIAVPQRLSALMLKMQQNDFLPKANFGKAIAMIHRSAKGQGGASTGANLCSQAACTVREGVLRYRFPSASATEKTDASALIRKSYDYLGSTLVTATNLEDDGIRVDNSYQSHQQTLYDGGYGTTLLDRTTEAAAWGQGTGFGLSKANVKQLVNYILDGGPQWMTRGLTYDPLASGRYWSRVTQVNTAAGLKESIDTAIELSQNYRKPELLRLRDRLADSIANKTASASLGPVGNRVYFVSDYMAHHRPGYMLSVNGASARTNTPESINGENLKAGYGTAGVNLVFQTGHEYDGIYAAWDWYRLPGTTSERSPDGTGGNYPLTPDHHFGQTHQVGGVSDGVCGAFVYAMSEYGLTANKAYFFFDQGMVALGNSVRQASPNTAGGVVGTTLNQTLLDGPVTYGLADGKTVTLPSDQSIKPDGLRWVNHAGVGYVFFEPAKNALLGGRKQSGSWQSINTAGSRQTVARDVFALDLLHGTKPSDAAYAYAILPNQSSSQTEATAKAMPFTVLRNDAVAQAVQAGDRTQAVFHANGSITLANGVELTKAGRETGVSLIWQATNTTVTLSLANTDRRGGPIVLTVNQRLTGEAAAFDAKTGLTTITAQPPSGHQAGSTVTLSFDGATKQY